MDFQSIPVDTSVTVSSAPAQGVSSAHTRRTICLLLQCFFEMISFFGDLILLDKLFWNEGRFGLIDVIIMNTFHTSGIKSFSVYVVYRYSLNFTLMIVLFVKMIYHMMQN